MTEISTTDNPLGISHSTCLTCKVPCYWQQGQADEDGWWIHDVHPRDGHDAVVEKTRWTTTELHAEAQRRFGSNVQDIKFVCPNCGDVASLRDFFDRDGDARYSGQECIGRRPFTSVPVALRRDYGPAIHPVASDRGCDFVAYGLFPGPWIVVFPDGIEVRSFRLAEGDQHD